MKKVILSVILLSVSSFSKEQLKFKTYVNDKKEIVIKVQKENKKNEELLLYTIKKGDTLEKLSKKFGVSIDNIMIINDLKNKNIKPGEKLIIPN